MAEQAGQPADASGVLTKSFRSREVPGMALTIQVAPDDCTGCGVCVDVCPAKSRTEIGHKAINMEPVEDHRDVERGRWDYFQSIPQLDRSLLPHDSVKGSQVLEPMFEFSGACSGCGETPYVKLLTQLFGDRALIANATGCSSIFGGTNVRLALDIGPKIDLFAIRHRYAQTSGALRFGMFVQVAFETGTGQRRTLVPRAAVIECTACVCAAFSV